MAHHRMAAGFGLAACLALFGACLQRAGYACERDTQCDLDGQSGRCVTAGYCAYPDAQCPSQLRYEANAPDDLGQRCVPPAAVGSSGTTGGMLSGTTGDASESSASDAADGSGGSASDTAGGPSTDS